MEQAVLFDVRDHVALITLNRPERRNSINRALLAGLYDALDEVSANERIRAAVVTGSGKSFCSGIDLSVIGKEQLFDVRGDGMELPDVFAACRKPVIGAVNGHAVTGGFEIALNCDFLIASENAMFADTHAGVGIHPGWGMTQLLQQAVGKRMAKQISLSCQFITAGQALGCGLVNEVVPAEHLMERALVIAGQICANRHDMVSAVRDLINYRDRASVSQALAREREGFREFLNQNMSARARQE